MVRPAAAAASTRRTALQPPIWSYRILAWALVLALAPVAGDSVAEARNNPPAASLKVSMPASMTRGSSLIVKASGYSGQYDAVSMSSLEGASSVCDAPDINTIGMVNIAKDHSFDVKISNIFGAPGTLTVCVYLFTSGTHANDTHGHYIAKSEHLRVS